MNPRFLGPMALGVIAVAGCRGSEHATRPATGAATAPAPPGAGDTGAMSHMPPMGSEPDTLAANLQTDLSRLTSAKGGELKAELPAHEAHLVAMLEDCKRMMADMKMTPPRKWTTLDASLRRDLKRFPTLPPAQLEASMPGHVERVKQLLTMRDDMMKEMEGGMKKM